MRRSALCTASLLLAMTFSAAAQEPSCPPPFGTFETARDALISFRERQNIRDTNRIAFLILRIIAPPPCPYLRDDQDPARVVDELIRFVASDGDPHVVIEFFPGVSGGLRSPERLPGLSTPLPALSFAVERGASEAARGAALSTRFRTAFDPQVRAYLLRWARAPVGPLLQPDLPERIISAAFSAQRR